MPGVLNLIRAGGASTEIHFGHRVAGAMPGVLNLIRASRVLILNLYQPAVSACGRGRPRTQDARGSIILHIAINAQSPSAPRPVGYSRFIAVLRYIRLHNDLF